MTQATDLSSGTEMRCPVGPRRLLAIMRARGDAPKVVPGNLIEFSCSDCTRSLRRQGHPNVVRVLHRYNVVGEFVETETVLGEDD